MDKADDVVVLAGGHYRLQAQLGGSAYGLVWRAQPVGGGPDVALKLVNAEQMARAQRSLQSRWIASAEREIAFLDTLAAWDERFIVRLLDRGTHRGLPVMALELMQADLSDPQSTASGPAQVLAWMGQLNQALATVHRYGWLYLDLKPANVLLSAQGSVKLADFGTNRLRSALPAATYAGTASWQAPEQFFPTAAGRYDTDARSDYFALGALFYYLATGGAQLRYCSSVGQAYRLHGDGAAAALRDQNGAMATTLQADEAALFRACFTRAQSTWWPGERAGPAPGADAALSLLRTLLAPARGDRPQHALQISRALAQIGKLLAPPHNCPSLSPARTLAHFGESRA
jgi:serine/threonine protein kinase